MFFLTLQSVKLKHSMKPLYILLTALCLSLTTLSRAQDIVDKPNTVSPNKLRSTYPHLGKVKNLVILVEYTDVFFTITDPKEKFTNFFNQTGYNYNNATGSVRDYFVASSFGAFEPSFDVYGPYRLSNPRKYYGEQVGERHDSNAAKMILEACELAKNDINYADYDNNNDGYVDNISVIFAGYNQAEHGPDEAIWPHRSSLSTSTTYNGKNLGAYLCTSELRSYQGSTMCGIGTYCHEFSHVLGVPDLYHTKESDTYTVGNWDIMAQGSYNNEGRTPPLHSAFVRFMLNWLVPEQLLTPNTFLLEPIETSNKAYLIAQDTHNLNTTEPSPNEYFLLENRQQVGWDSVAGQRVGDSAIPGTGLLCSHITFDMSTWTNNTFNNSTPLGYDIVEAYHIQNQTIASPGDTYPGSYGINLLTPTLNNGAQLQEQMLSNIMQLDNDISFHYGPIGGDGIWFDPINTIYLKSEFDKKIITTQIDSVTLICQNINEHDITIRSLSPTFELSNDQRTWHGANSYLTLNTDDQGNLRQTIYLRFQPLVQNCGYIYGMIEAASTNRTYVNRLMLRGTSPRPNYLNTPTIYSVEDLTPYSFKIRWTEQEDAESYYLTIYTVDKTESDIVQSFEEFDSQEQITAQQWESNFCQTTTAQSDHGSHSLLITETAQYITSQTYLTPVTQLSFWINNNYTSSDSGTTPGGRLFLYARNNNQDNFQLIDSIFVRTSTRYLTQKYNFEETDSIVQFKLTYQHLAGNGGVLLDSWTAHSNSTINYLYKNKEYEVQAPQTVALISELKPNTTYYIQLQAEESKGCQTNTTPLIEPYPIRTLIGTDKQNQILIIDNLDDTFTAYLPESGDASKKLLIYDVEGHLMLILDIAPSATQIIIPASQLHKGQTYFCKYTHTDRTQRKEAWGKFIYY